MHSLRHHLSVVNSSHLIARVRFSLRALAHLPCQIKRDVTPRSRVDCSHKVTMGLTCLFCSEKKKLISHESVKKLRLAASAIKKFRNFETKAFAPASGWLCPEKNF